MGQMVVSKEGYFIWCIIRMVFKTMETNKTT